MAKAVYWQEGNNIDYKNTTEELIPAGAIVVFGGRTGIAGTDIPAGEAGALAVTGVFRMPKGSEEIAAGDTVYFDADAETVTKIAETGESAAKKQNAALGYAVEAAASGAAEILVKLMG